MNKKLAFVFPGQGSQSVGMLSELAGEYPIVTTLFHKASDILGYDLWEIVKEGPTESLNQTEKTQPALLVAGVAIWQIWLAKNGSKPGLFAGHSLGEYTALVCANALDFDTAVKLVAKRGYYMQQAVPEGEGAMAAIVGLTDFQVAEICDTAANQNQILAPANYNSIGQVVIAGHKPAVQNAIQLAETAGAKMAMILPVSVPSHCLLMKPAAKAFAEDLAAVKFKRPEITIINNVDVAHYDDEHSISDALTRQLYHPVRWVETVKKFKEYGIEKVAEAGPGRVLSGLIKRIDRTLFATAINDPKSLQDGLQTL